MLMFRATILVTALGQMREDLGAEDPCVELAVEPMFYYLGNTVHISKISKFRTSYK